MLKKRVRVRERYIYDPCEGADTAGDGGATALKTV